jgi:adenosylcobinamide-phosphate synthase
LIWLLVFIAYSIDLIVGDPKSFPHPVVLIGKLISFLDERLRRPGASKEQKRFMGSITVFAVVAMSASITWIAVSLATIIHPLAGKTLSILFISATIATRGLMKSAREVAALLGTGNLDEARAKVSMIVGRDTANMKQHDIARATIETVAENLVDAVIAPIMFALIGGAPLAMAYRSINTLDSMLGYRNDKYKDFGWAAARLDDIANYIPARISVVIIAIAALLCRGNPVDVLRTALKFGGNHASPNSGWPEAAVAGAFDLRLGGTNYYGGIPRKTGFIGDGSGVLEEKHIENTVTLLFVASAATVVLAGAAYLVSKTLLCLLY